MRNYHKTVIKYVSEMSGLPKSDILRKKKYSKYVEARMAVTYFLLRDGYSIAKISRIFDVHHTTVMHWRDNLKKKLELEKEYGGQFYTDTIAKCGISSLHNNGGHSRAAVLDYMDNNDLEYEREFMSDIIDQAAKGLRRMSTEFLFENAF